MNAVVVETVGAVGYLTLSQDATLNALTLDMIDALQAGLNAHESNKNVATIVLRSKSARAFCAGGDMKRIRQLAIDKDHEEIRRFFTREYAYNLAVAECSKPYISLIDGIAMGGGLGLSIHGQFVIATEKAVMAMPESRIGFFPDVGASYFLKNLKHNCTHWFALTAAPLRGSHTLIAGLATHYVDSANLAQLMIELEQLEISSPSGTYDRDVVSRAVAEKLEPLAKEITDDAFEELLAQRAQWFEGNDINIMKARLIESADDNDDAKHLLTLLNKGSPYSYAITMELLQKTEGMDLAKCLQAELELAFKATTHPDLIEGVRAVLVDKDHNAQWQ